MKQCGTMWRAGDGWKISCEAHVSVMMKRVFGRLSSDKTADFSLPDTPQICFELTWFLQRYPLYLEQADVEYLAQQTAAYNAAHDACENIFAEDYQPREFDLTIEPRLYQMQAGELAINAPHGGLLLADEVGLGKTCSAICALRGEGALPATVVCQAHLCTQWKRELEKFAPDLVVHIIDKMDPYPLPTRHGPPDVLILSYNKLNGWQHVLKERTKTLVADEVQELRHTKTKKYDAAKVVTRHCRQRLGLSATPIYNYGGEIYNVQSIITPGALGTWEEFTTEWCDSDGGKAKLKDPAAFGSWMQDQHLMLRRTRVDVGRELPPLTVTQVDCDCNAGELMANKGKASELARLMLNEETSPFARAQATAQFDTLLRQDTGIGKAPHVAKFVETLLENDEPVVLFGWHHAVYEIWMDLLDSWHPAMYTGDQSAGQKDAAVPRFLKGDRNGGTNLLILSLRSGAGLDGLQKRCNTCVFGELDWSPAVHEQCVGRIYRDGQERPGLAYFMISEDGIDPIIAEVLGVKRDQSNGLLYAKAADVMMQTDHAAAVRRLARQYLTGGKV